MLRSRFVRKIVLGGACVGLAAASLFIPVGGVTASSSPMNTRSNPAPDAATPLSTFSSAAPGKPLRLLFIHHSVGGRLMADPGERQPLGDEIWKSHPNGGGLRRMLEQQGYEVHEASYGSEIGSHTDRADWPATFRDKMSVVTSCALNDQRLPDGQKNQIVVFKSCFPENLLADEAAEKRAREDLTALLPVIAQHPETLFVYLTTPPLAPNVRAEPAWKYVARVVTGKPQPGPRLARSGPAARRLNDWIVSPDGWLKGSTLKNLAVFDLYDVLTDHGRTNFLAFPTDGGYDSHPSREGNQKVAADFVPFLNRAVRRAGLAE